MAGIIDHESMLTDPGMEASGLIVDKGHGNLLQNMMSSDMPYLTPTSNSNSAISTQQTSLLYPLAQSSTSLNPHPHSHTEMSTHIGMGMRLDGGLTTQDSTSVTVMKDSTDSLRFNYPMNEESYATKQKPKKAASTVYKEQERFVPINNIGRVMRNAVPRNAKISKDAKQCMQECVSEFVSFLTSEASDRCIDEKRKTITGDDILYSLSTLGFDNHVEPLQQYLKKYREFLHVDKPSKDGDDAQVEDAILRASLQLENHTDVNAHTLQLLTGQLPANPQSSLPRL